MQKPLKTPVGLRIGRKALSLELLGFKASFAVFAILFLFSTGFSQEALQNSVKGQKVATDRDEMMKKQDYTVKYGDFRMLVAPSLSADWNDNVNLSETNKLDDFIIRPGVGITASYPLTQRNVLFLDINVGYERYLKNPDLSTFDLNSSSGTGLSFDIGIKDVTINLHDWMSYSQDSGQNSQVANTANYGTFENTAGVSADWLLNQLTISGGYDYQYVRSTSAEFDNINHSANMLFLRSGLEVHPQATVGLETTAAYTTYEQDKLNNNDAYTAGAYTVLLPGKAVSLTMRGGFATYQFKSSSSTVSTSDNNSWYANVNWRHAVLENVSYNLDAGRSTQLGTESDLTEIWYVRPNINWDIIQGWGCTTGFFYEHGKEGTGNIIGNSTENYDYYGGNLALTHELTKNISLSLTYRLTLRSSDENDSSYTQNLVGLRLTYHPK